MIDLRLGDCLEVLRGMAAGSVDAVVTDPPYGTGAWLRPNTGAGSDCRAVLSKEPWDTWSTGWIDECLRIAQRVIAFVPQTHMVEVWRRREPCRLLMWVKPDPRPRFAGQPAYGIEPIIALGGVESAGGMDYCIKSAPRVNRDSEAVGHPHQKPLDVLTWLVNLACPDGGTILDPFMGSGTTGVACVQTGRNFLGIEIDEGYFKIAQTRIAQAQAQPALLAAPAVDQPSTGGRQ